MGDKYFAIRSYLSYRELPFALLNLILTLVVALVLPAVNYVGTQAELGLTARYVYSFWKHQWWYAFLLVGYSIFLFQLGMSIRETYIKHSAYPSSEQRATLRRAKRDARIVHVGTVMTLALGLPFVVQRLPILIWFLICGLTLLAILILNVSADRTDVIGRLGTYRFPNVSFNVAALAPLSEEVQTKLREFQRTRMSGGITSQSGSILNTAKDVIFKGLQRLLSVDDPNAITLAFNTTSAIRIAIDEVNHYCLTKHTRMPLILTSDADYPAILELIRGNAEEIVAPPIEREPSNVTDLVLEAVKNRYDSAVKEYEVLVRPLYRRRVRDVVDELYKIARQQSEMPYAMMHVIPIAKQILAGSLSTRDIANLFKGPVSAALKANRPVLIVTAHVHWQTGFVLNLEEFVKELGIDEKLLHDMVYIVIDGAQAMGHILLPSYPDMYRQVTYYAGCTHKWLLGKETLGVLIRGTNTEHIRRLPPDGSMFTYADQFYSGYGGTINVESFVGTSVSLAEITSIGMDRIVAHNLDLVSLFRTGIHSIDGLRARDELGSSLVLVECNARLVSKIVREYEKRRRNIVSVVPVTSGAPHGDGIAYLRFCFHYFHSEKDVLDLIEELETIVAKVS